MSIGPPNLPGLPRLPGLPGGGNNAQPLSPLQPSGLDGDGLPPLPPGIAGRVLERGFDSLPPGLARQLGDAGRNPPAVPTPGSAPATPNLPGSVPASPLAAPGLPGQAAAAPLANPVVPNPPASTPGLPSSPMAALATAVNQVVANVAGTLRGAMTPLPANAVPNPAPGAAPNAMPNTSPAVPNAVPLTPPRTAIPNAAPNTVPTPVPTAIPNAAPAAAPAANSAVPVGNTAQMPRADGLPTPARPDAAPVPQRADPNLLERLANLLRPGGTMQTAQAPSTLPAAGTTQTLTLTALPLLLVPPSQSPADARGITTLLAANDRAGMQRPDVMLAGVYTADGPLRRRVRRGENVMPARLSRWLIALGHGGAQITRAQADPEAALSAAMQWLFWVLAVIAYACLGLALVALLPAGSDVLGSSGRTWTGGFAFAGLVAAAGAWWFARHLSARSAPDDPPSQGGHDEG